MTMSALSPLLRWTLCFCIMALICVRLQWLCGWPWRRTRTAFDNTVRRLQADETLKTCNAVAILVSSDVKSFAYRDLLSNGVELGSCQSADGIACRGIVDVYMLLADTKFSNTEASDDGADDVFHPEVLDFYYKSKGVNNVSITILREDDLANTFVEFQWMAAKIGSGLIGTTPEAWWASVQRIPGFEEEFWHIFRRLYLRHMVYVMAIDAERSAAYRYSHFVSAGQGNSFLQALNLTDLACALGQCFCARNQILTGAEQLLTQGGTAAAAVDLHCAADSHSDTVYLANTQAAEVLFGANATSHARHIAVWLLGAKYKSLRLNSEDQVHPLQAQYFLQFLLDAAHINVADWGCGRTSSPDKQAVEKDTDLKVESQKQDPPKPTSEGRRRRRRKPSHS